MKALDVRKINRIQLSSVGQSPISAVPTEVHRVKASLRAGSCIARENLDALARHRSAGVARAERRVSDTSKSEQTHTAGFCFFMKLHLTKQ